MFDRKTFVLAAFLMFAFLGVSLLRADDQKIFRVYFIGNSVTDMVRYPQFADLAVSRNVKLQWGRTMIPGAPLEWIYGHPDEGFEEEPYGHWQKALSQFPWDAVSCQPFDRQLHDINDKTSEDVGDVALITHFAEMAAKQNPDVQLYIYARWPRISRDGKPFDFNKDDYDPTKKGSLSNYATLDDYAKLWDRPYTGGWDFSNESRDYFDKLLTEVRSKTPFLKKPAQLIPVGQVMDELSKKIANNQIPNYSSVYQFYKDGIHLNEAGTYVVGCTFFAAMLKQSPIALPTQPYGDIPPDVAKIIQETAWQVVSTQVDAGLKEAAVKSNP